MSFIENTFGSPAVPNPPNYAPGYFSPGLGSPGPPLTATNAPSSPGAPPYNPGAASYNAGAAANAGSPPAPAAGVTSGYYIFIAMVGGILFSGTKFAPIIAGILGVALIYQLNQMLA